MNHITREKATELDDSLEYEIEKHSDFIHALCNAAIEWYIAQQAAREPVAYFDFQKRGFVWAKNVSIGYVPMSVKFEPMPLYSEPDMYKSESKTNTSQERVKKSEEFKQMLEALKDAHAHIDYDLVRERIGNVIAAVEAKNG